MQRASRIPAQGPIAPSRSNLRVALSLSYIVADGLLIYAGFTAAGAAYLGELPAHIALRSAGLLVMLYTVLGTYSGAFSSALLVAFRKSALRSISALALAATLLVIILFYVKASEDFSRGVFTLGLAFSIILMLAVRALGARAIGRAWGPRMDNVLVIDDEGPPVDVTGAYRLCSARDELRLRSDDPHQFDRLGTLLSNMDRVIVSCPLERRPEWAAVLRSAGVRGEVVSDILYELGALALHREENFSSIVVSVGPLGTRARAVKRAMDLCGAGAALALLLPAMIVIACAIKLEDGGPILFIQRRMGRGNRFFQMLKFRSMHHHQGDARGAISTGRQDSRVTKVGRFLRRTSLDELPQLLNVLRGHMSLVGPRPHALGSQAGSKLFWDVDPRYWNRHTLRPGLTGLAQIRGYRGATDHEEDLTKRLNSDLEYIATWSPWKDLMIMIKTVRVLVHAKAY